MGNFTFNNVRGFFILIIIFFLLFLEMFFSVYNIDNDY